jgi:hypothetical protein
MSDGYITTLFTGNRFVMQQQHDSTGYRRHVDLLAGLAHAVVRTRKVLTPVAVEHAPVSAAAPVQGKRRNR